MLICEGACNPSLPAFDAAASAYASWMKLDGHPPGNVMTSLERYRRLLKHTPHEHIAGNRYACTVCGCERQYGPAWAALTADGWRVA